MTVKKLWSLRRERRSAARGPAARGTIANNVKIKKNDAGVTA